MGMWEKMISAQKNTLSSSSLKLAFSDERGVHQDRDLARAIAAPDGTCRTPCKDGVCRHQLLRQVVSRPVKCQWRFETWTGWE